MDNHGQVEITAELTLEAPQRRLLDVHSVVNILTIVVYEIELVGALVGDKTAADQLAKHVIAWSGRMNGRVEAETVKELGHVAEIRDKCIDWVIACRPQCKDGQLPELDSHLDNFRSVFGILQTRAAELLSRVGDRDDYRRFTLDHLRGNMQSAFAAIEKNSFGRYRIVYSPEEHSPGDYLMELDLGSCDGESIQMPAVFEDVIRDLACNARKYTNPGGSIRVTLADEADGSLFLQVQDDGRGIPEDEIEHVVSFGCRASSEANRAQTGGGFGLTKAYFVTKKFGGRMWIKSSPGIGTSVTIKLPRPSPVVTERTAAA